MILIGTSGFSYTDWKGLFYPADIAARNMLNHYSQYFKTCEINATFYRMPTAATLQSMLQKTDTDFIFVIKAPQSMTHTRTASAQEYRAFAEALKPLQMQNRLGAVLAQFPYSFPNTLEHRGFLADLKAQMPKEVDLVVEFRHQSWQRAETENILRELELGSVNVDEPPLHGLMSPSERVTSRVGYVRFHGRNQKNWFKHDAQPWERYDYLYTADELKEWVPRIKNLAVHTQNTFVFFNNHWQSQAVKNACQMSELLDIPLKKPWSDCETNKKP